MRFNEERERVQRNAVIAGKKAGEERVDEDY